MSHRSSSHVSRRGFLARLGEAGTAAVVSLKAQPLLMAEALTVRARPTRPSILGHDLSTLQQEESVGRSFSDAGRVAPVERIVKRHGATHVRLRLWVDPPIPFNDLPHLLTMARRVKGAGLKLLVDLHYSDFWADAGNQTTPKRWEGQDLVTLATTVHDYTASVLKSLADQGTPADMVQIGNEITSGMLWPQGKLYVGDTQRWTEFTTLLKAGIAGARAAASGGHGPRIMVHIDRGGDNPGSTWFYDHIREHGVTFDVIGLSFYPWWHGAPAALRANLVDLAHRYRKDIIVVETAYPWTLKDGDRYPNLVGPGTYLYASYKPTPKGQKAYLRHLISILRGVPGGHGAGLFYWEPAWVPGVGWKPGEGDAWDNLTLFDFKGRSLPAIDAFRSIHRLVN